MKKIFLFLIFFLFANFLFCYHLTLVSEGETNYISKNWLIFINKIPLKDKLDNYRIRFIEQINHKENPLCKIYHLYPRGHILIPYYKELPPIKSFSVVSDFDSKSKGYEYAVLEELKAAFKFLESYSLGELEEVEKAVGRNTNQWNKLIQMELERTHLEESELLSIKSKTDRRTFILKDKLEVKLEAFTAPPLLETKWGQGEPFWNWCPLLGSERCFVGCVNTATAQIMRYYKWPKKGKGEHSYYWDNGGKWLGADFSDSYDWDHMPNEYWDYDTQIEKDAVAELCYEVGVSAETNYHPEGSWVYYFEDVVYALKNYFKYSNAAKVVYRKDYGNLDEWFEILKTERDSSRPLEFAMYGYDEVEEEWLAHAVVIDGYLITNGLKQIHINMGWYGFKDAYYTLDNILDYTSTYYQQAITKIIPVKKYYTFIVTAGKGGTTDPTPGIYTYGEGTKVSVKAIPDNYYIFNGWSGAISGKTNPITITMNSNKSITANFRLIYPPSNFTGQKVLNRSLSQAEYINVLKWEANPNNVNINIVIYRIYQIEDDSQSLLIELGADQFEYWHRRVEKDKQYTYAIVAVNNEDREGKPIYITIQ